MDNGAQRASGDPLVPSRSITRSYPFVSWHPGPDAQPAGTLGAISPVFRPATATGNLHPARPRLQARPMMQARPIIADRAPVAVPLARPHWTLSRSPASARAVIVPLLALLVSLAGFATSPAPASASGSAPKPKAVIIVGPVGSLTSYYHDMAEAMAQSAERHGMDVRRLYSPHATWSNVLKNIQGAKLVISLMHGNGWPSPYPPFQTDTKDGFGLNPYDGASSTSTKYYGEGPVAANIKLADNAVVLLSHMCYSAGNGENGSVPTESYARERVDNFAAGFLKAGARAVFAYYWKQKADFLSQLWTKGKTMDQVFMTRGNGDYDGYAGGDIRFSSQRSHGYSVHMDHSSHGYLRSVVGNLSMTTDAWQGPKPEPDGTPPVLTGLSSTPTHQATTDVDDAPSFSPNGDGIRDRLRLYHTLSEDAWLGTTIERQSDRKSFGRFKVWARAGRTSTTWDGRDGSGRRIPDGVYVLTVRPRDPAGNRGDSRSITVRILTLLKAPGVSRSAILAADGDGLAASTTLSTSISHDAKLFFEITDHHGTIVARWASVDVVRAGRYHWTWSGRYADGRFVPSGLYHAVTTAVSDARTDRYRTLVFVGAFRVYSANKSPARGQRVTFSIRTTEPLRGTPTLTITQPGLRPYSVSTHGTATQGRYEATVTLADAGQAGHGTIRVSGTDTGGKIQSTTAPLEVD